MKVDQRKWWRTAFLFRLVLLAVLITLLVAVVGLRKEKNILRPTPVSAAEIILRNLEKFIRPDTIYHQKTKQYLGGSKDPNTYEIWEDQESDRFYNEAIYADGQKFAQGFNLEFRWDIDYANRTVHKDIYVYDNQPGVQPVGKRVDIAEQFDELIRNGVLEAKEGKLGGHEVYVVYDTRTDPEKHWDILTFDKNTFQILQTEKYGADGKIEELMMYEIQEAVERNEANLAKFFTYQDPDGDFVFYQRNFYTSKPDQEEYVLVSGIPQGPQSAETECEKWLKECAKEGENRCTACGCRTCCPGLVSRDVTHPYRTENNEVVCLENMTAYTCVKCGDGICGQGEDWCICPEDCPKPHPEDLQFRKIGI